jgi:hypothetical protein
MKCSECRWHFNLDETYERTEWKNCLALPYPQCLSYTHVNAECPIPNLFRAKDDPPLPAQ